jgi:hypothetical protein
MLLKDKYPRTKDEFDEALNKGLNLDIITIGSRRKIVWKCPKGNDHIWEASPNQRTSGHKLRGCPICAGKIVVNSSSLAFNNPIIAKEWNFEKTFPITPNKISVGSNKKVWWRCIINPLHEWKASPKQRTRQNNSCPFCNSLGVRFPEIAKEWHPVKNTNLTPINIPYSSHKKVWWKCEKGFDHIWQASPNARTSMKTGCPICSGHRVIKSNSLAAVFPEISVQWNYKKNDNLTPEQVYCKSNKKAWWICPEANDHVWQSAIKTRANGFGCPICSGRKVAKSNSLQQRYPSVANLWHPTANKDLTPFQVTPFSSKLIWWKCPEGDEHEWQASVANVVNGSTCPVCMNRKITSENNLSFLFPNLIREWDYEKNMNIDPSKIGANSKIKVWWICRRDKDHFWYSTIKDRIQKGSGCPFCANKMNVSEYKMFEFIKEIFNGKEVRYCYRPDWLQRMEVDAYVPDLRLGFEYQGIQHFRPISYFGGEETYIAQVQRDKLKKEICYNEKITLVYVYYNEKLSKELLTNKILNSGISIE